MTVRLAHLRRFRPTRLIAAMTAAVLSVTIAMGAVPAAADSTTRPAMALPAIDQKPAGDVLLIIGNEGDEGGPAYYFDLETLKALPQDDFHTSTIWTEGVQHFEGVRLYDLIKALGVEGGTLWLTAINGYLVELPVEDLRADGGLIAFARNGVPMTARDKGPLWLVFPYDSNTRWQTETVYARSIWQLVRIDIER